ncbi:hypothetical protein SUGI_1152110 [Cryptomeria japonica]|nr:hypothetical protein SUGI_1152110 [Cryptomeria japonica]
MEEQSERMILQTKCEAQKKFGETLPHQQGACREVPHVRESVRQGVTKWKVLDVDWIDAAEQNEKDVNTSQNQHPRSNNTEFPRSPRHNLLGCEIDLSEVVKDDRSIFKQHAIIARVIGPKLPRKDIRAWVDTNWGNHVVLKFLSKGFFVAIFVEPEERNHILQLQNWYLEGHPLYVQPWAPNFEPTPLAVYEKPVWIRQFNLPTEYWSDPRLEIIDRSLGTLLEIDEGIIGLDLYTYARIKITAVKKIPDYITLVTKDGVWLQQVKVEQELIPCHRCGSRTHTIDRCDVYVRKAHNKPSRMANWDQKGKDIIKSWETPPVDYPKLDDKPQHGGNTTELPNPILKSIPNGKPNVE